MGKNVVRKKYTLSTNGKYEFWRGGNGETKKIPTEISQNPKTEKSIKKSTDGFWEYEKVPMESTKQVRPGFGSMKKYKRKVRKKKKVRTEIGQNPKYETSTNKYEKKYNKVRTEFGQNPKYEKSTKKSTKKYTL